MRRRTVGEGRACDQDRLTCNTILNVPKSVGQCEFWMLQSGVALLQKFQGIALKPLSLTN